MDTAAARWCAARGDEGAFTAWIADRACATGRHLAPVVAVGRLDDGRIAVDVLLPGGLPLASALDVLGTPTSGVAVTLSTPILELAVAARSGAVLLGDTGLDDVLVDDAGAVVVCDRPPAAIPVPIGTEVPPGPSDAEPLPGGATRTVSDEGARTLVLAARVVWERVDPAEPVRPAVDEAIAAALDGDAVAVRSALAVVRAAAAPRPVRWAPPSVGVLGLAGPEPATPPATSIVDVLRDLVEHGVPLGAARRLPLRQAVVGAVVAVGLAAAVVFALGG